MKKLRPEKIQEYCKALNERGHNVNLDQAKQYLENILEMRRVWKNLSVVEIWESAEKANLDKEEINELVEFINLVREL